MKTVLSFFVFLSCLTFAARGCGQTLLSGGAVLSGSATVGVSSGTPTAATPTANPVAGTYSSAQSVTLSTSTSGATLCYTTDGTSPAASTPGTCSAGTTYSSAISVSSSLTIKALATESGYLNSGLLTAAYTISGGSSGAAAVIVPNIGRTGDNALAVPQGGATIDSITLPQQLNFYYQNPNTSSAALPISISNCYNPQYSATFGVCGTVNGSFTVTSMAISGTNASDFALSGTCGTIASGEDCEPTITFTPTSASGTTENATLTVNLSGANVASLTLPLTGVSQTMTTVSASGCPTALVSGYSQLTTNISCAGTAFTAANSSTIFNLNGHTITYGNTSSASQANGIQVNGGGVSLLVYNGTITEGAGTNTYGANIPESGPIGYSGSNGFSGTSVFANLTLTANAQYSHAIQMNGGQPDIHDVIMNLNGVGTCNTVGCRAEMQGAAFYQENATSTSGMTIYNTTQNGGPQGGLVPESGGLIAYNSLNPGNVTGTNTNGFGIAGYCNGCTFADNSIMTPMTAGSATRGIIISAAVGGQGQNIDVTHNIIGAFDNATNSEYSGCQGGGTYALQIDDNPPGPNTTSDNYVQAWSKTCTSSGLRLTDSETNSNAGTDDTYNASHVSGFSPCTFNIDTTATGGCAVGMSMDGPTGYTSTGHSFSGDDADVLFDIKGGTGITFHTPTFAKPATASAGFHTFVSVTGTPAQGGGSVANVHFIDPIYGAGTSPADIQVPAQSSIMGAVTFYPADWTQTMQVNKASGPAASGAVVTWTDAASDHYTCTTNSSGACTVVLSQYEDGNMTGANQANSLNPYSLSVPLSGCTTYTQSGIAISATGTKNVSLSGC